MHDMPTKDITSCNGISANAVGFISFQAGKESVEGEDGSDLEEEVGELLYHH